MKKKLFDTFLKLHLFEILYIEHSYFKVITLNNRKKISKDVILLNYSEYSPYKDSSLIYLQNEKSIHLWFTDKKQNTNITLPESYILSHYFQKKNIEGIILFETSPQKLLLIKDNELKYQLSKKKISNYEISLLQKEFSTSQIYTYTEKEYQETLHLAIEALSPMEMFKFLSLELDYKTLLNLFIKKSAIPIALFVSILLIIEFTNKFYLQKQLEQVESQYKSIRVKSASLRESMYDIEDKMEKYKQLDKELEVNQKFMNIMQSLSKILEDNNSSFLFLRVSESEFRVKIDTNSTSKVFSDIVQSHYLKDLRIQSSRKNRYNDGESVIITGKIN